MRRLRLVASWSRPARPGGPLSQVWRAVEGGEMTVETTRFCAWKVHGGMLCAEPAVVTSCFTMDGYAEEGRFTSLWVRVKGLTCGHAYQEEVANLGAITPEDKERLTTLDHVKAKRTPSKWGEGNMPCIMCGEPVAQRLAADMNEGAGKYCERCR